MAARPHIETPVNRRAADPFSVSRTILRGLAILVPLLALVASITWTLYTLEHWLAKVFRFTFSSDLYVPGLGLLLGVVLSFSIGLLMNTATAQKLYGLFEQGVQRIPLIKSIYGAVQDIIGTFSTDRRKRYNRVVIVRFREANVQLVGFVTQEDLTKLPLGINDSELVAVYLPMSYQIGGYMVFVPKSTLEPVNLSVEDASRLILTAGMSASHSNETLEKN